MPQTIRTLIQIFLFRAKPQDLDASVNLLVVAIATALGLFIVRNNLLMAETNILLISLVQVGLLGLGLRVLLVLFSKSNRWLQSATALYGCCALMLFATTLFIVLLNGSDSSMGNLLLMQVAIIAFGLWYFAVIIFIIRETLEVSGVLAFFLAFALEFSFTIILLKLFGGQLL